MARHRMPQRHTHHTAMIALRKVRRRALASSRFPLSASPPPPWQSVPVRRDHALIAVASGGNEALLRDLGADGFINNRRTAAEDAVHDLDLVADAVGGPTTGRFLRTLKRGGACSRSSRWASPAARLGVTVSTTQVRSNGAQLAEIAPLLDSGTIRIAIDSTFPLAEARKAHERAAAGSIQGKIVLTLDR